MAKKDGFLDATSGWDRFNQAVSEAAERISRTVAPGPVQPPPPSLPEIRVTITLSHLGKLVLGKKVRYKAGGQYITLGREKS